MKEKSATNVTLKDVAQRAGVSLATVSYAINGTGSIGKGTRDKILLIARQMGYQPNRSAQTMRTGRSSFLGLIVPNITNPYFALLAQSVINEAATRNYSVFLVDSEGSHHEEVSVARSLVQNGVDGIIWFPVNDQNSLKKEVLDIPVVVVDRHINGYDLVQAEFAQGGQMMGEHLLAQGHRKFAMVDGPRDVLNSRQRSDHAKSAVETAGEVVWRLENSYSTELRPKVRKMLGGGGFTAVICGNDLIAAAVCAELQSKGVKVPVDVSVVGYEDSGICQIVYPKITTVHIPITDMGAEAVHMLFRRLDSPSSASKRVVFDVSLVKRASDTQAGPGK